VTAVIWLRLAVGNAVTFLIESSRRHRDCSGVLAVCT
jgi:hypothetical protein